MDTVSIRFLRLPASRLLTTDNVTVLDNFAFEAAADEGQPHE